ncbi:MAG TPA: NADH-quinone oxidoreductase subunit M [Candidatus Dormibacteraeota bacterium]|jgi:NADH-quinone oxidoreductase subunit M
MSLFLAAIPTPSATPIPVFGSGVIGFSFLLSTIVWAPVVWALVLATVPNPRGRYDRFFFGSSFWVTFASLALSFFGYIQFQSFTTGPQFEEKLPWLPAFGITYHLGADGVSMLLLLANGIVALTAILASTGIRARPREYFVLLLLAEAAVNGLVCARDLFMLALFWSAAVVPVALLVAGWGVLPGRRLGAAVRLLGYWGLGSAVLLLAAVVLAGAAAGGTFDLDYLSKTALPARTQVVIGILVVVAAATRLGLWPLHGWAREVLAEAPAGIAILVAGAGMRGGGYLLIRLLDASLHDGTRLLAPLLASLAGLTAIWCGLAAFRSRDIRLLGAYLAIIPGCVTVLGSAGVTPLSIDGAAFSLFAGAAAAALIVGACALVAERAQTRDLALLGGLAGRLPRLSWLLVLAAIGVLGLPLTGTFVGELMVFFGAFKIAGIGAFAAAAGLLIAGAAVAWMLQRVLFGAPNPDAPAASDAPLTETWALAVLAGSLIYLGVVPGGPKLAGIPFLDPGVINVVNATVADLASTYAPPSPPVPGAGG